MSEVGSAEWLAEKGQEGVRFILQQFLQVHLQSDGTIRMTQGHSSDLTEYFTIRLMTLDAFNRSNGVLDYLEQEAIKLRYGKRMSYKQIARELRASESTAKRCVNEGLYKVTQAMVGLVCEN